MRFLNYRLRIDDRGGGGSLPYKCATHPHPPPPTPRVYTNHYNGPWRIAPCYSNTSKMVSDRPAKHNPKWRTLIAMVLSMITYKMAVWISFWFLAILPCLITWHPESIGYKWNTAILKEKHWRRHNVWKGPLTVMLLGGGGGHGCLASYMASDPPPPPPPGCTI